MRPDATIEELDEWIIAIGGRELTEAEARELYQHVQWHDIPGERVEAGAVLPK